LFVIDCDICFGTQSSWAPDVAAGDLIKWERSNGVAYGLACSVKSRAFDARIGNDEALRAAREHPGILPVASVDPREHCRFEAEIARVAELGFAAVRVFPELQQWPVDSLLFSRVVNACAQHCMPLMVSANASGRASEVVRLAHHTTSPIILLGVSYNTLSEALAAAAARPNTYVCTQLFVTPGSIDIAAEAIGADRLVLGSGCPEYSVRPAINMVMASELSEEDKANVLGGNLARIIKPQIRKLGETLTDSGFEKFEERRLRGSKIDVHGHIGPWPFPMTDCWAADLEKMMRKSGIERAIISSTEAIVNDFVAGNAAMAREMDKTDMLLGYVTVSPSRLEQSVDEMDRYLAQPKFVGVKLHPSYAGVSIDSEPVMRLSAEVAKRRVPFLIHTWGHGEPSKILKLANEFPEMPIIMGHGGATAWREGIDVLKKTHNTYTEFCASLSHRDKVRETIDAVGYDRVLFGTDLGLFDPAYVLGTYEEAALTNDEEAAIMRDNARRLFSLDR
jgi:predicted TIM-barrel fold metal-dependent hydrolase